MVGLTVRGWVEESVNANRSAGKKALERGAMWVPTKVDWKAHSLRSLKASMSVCMRAHRWERERAPMKGAKKGCDSEYWTGPLLVFPTELE